MRHAVGCGLANVAIQSYFTTAAMNLKKLAAHAAPQDILKALQTLWKRFTAPKQPLLTNAA